MDESYNWAALAVPVFLGATLVEVAIARRSGRDLYAFGTALSDMACGSVYQAAEIVFKLLFVAAYAWLYDHGSLVDWDPSSPWPWVIGMLGVDFMFYAWHRVSHVVNIMWAIHGVHHQSEDYNLAVALRQPIFEPVSWFFFYAPLALLGVSPIMYVAAYGVNRFYQFWIHTEVVGKGPRVVEWLLNTPSHHRVHHGVNPQYLDKNYGAVLIIWDRLLGTFEPEVEQPVYGTTVPLRSYNPLWANFVHIDRIRTLGRLSSTTAERLWAWVAHPAWLPKGVSDPAAKVEREGYRKYRPTVAPAVRIYLAVHFALTGIAMSVVVFYEHWLGPLQLLVAGCVFITGFVAFLGIVEAQRWAWPLEVARTAATALGAGWLLHGGAGWDVLPALGVTGALSALCAVVGVVLRPRTAASVHP